MSAFPFKPVPLEKRVVFVTVQKRGFVNGILSLFNDEIHGFREISLLNMLKIPFTNPRFCTVTKT